MEQHLEGFKSVSLQDITSMYTVLTLVGPKAKDLMAEMCETGRLFLFQIIYPGQCYQSLVVDKSRGFFWKKKSKLESYSLKKNLVYLFCSLH